MSFTVKVRHIPSIFFVVVIVGVGAMVGGGDTLGIGGRGTIVEVNPAENITIY